MLSHDPKREPLSTRSLLDPHPNVGNIWEFKFSAKSYVSLHTISWTQELLDTSSVFAAEPLDDQPVDRWIPRIQISRQIAIFPTHHLAAVLPSTPDIQFR